MTQYVEWDDVMNVGIDIIDNQHKHLIQLINGLHEAMVNRKSRQILGETITALFNYAQTHFQTEEEYFAAYNYPDKAIHEEQHLDFIKKVFNFKAAFDAEPLCLSTDILAFLSEWLVTHIKKSDAKIREHITPRLK